jgi:hypothetical protein
VMVSPARGQPEWVLEPVPVLADRLAWVVRRERVVPLPVSQERLLALERVSGLRAQRVLTRGLARRRELVLAPGLGSARLLELESEPELGLMA